MGDELPPSNERALVDPMFALAVIDTLEYHGILDLERSSTERRRVFEATSLGELEVILEDIVHGLSEEDQSHLLSLSGERFQWIDETLFELDEDE